MSPPRHQVIAPVAPLHTRPDSAAEMVSEMLFGEELDVLEDRPNWVKALSLRDGYEGYTYKNGVGPAAAAPTHRIAAVQTHLYRAPDYKTPPVTSLPFLASLRLKTAAPQNGFAELENGLWVWAGHTEPLAARREDYVETALRFVGTPYLWGGKTCAGLDCSGLVQIALWAAGLPCPRDTKDQIGLGAALADDEPLRRGDLVFLERHVGIMIDEARILNATARTMDTRIENLDEMAQSYPGGILARKRL